MIYSVARFNAFVQLLDAHAAMYAMCPAIRSWVNAIGALSRRVGQLAPRFIVFDTPATWRTQSRLGIRSRFSRDRVAMSGVDDVDRAHAQLTGSLTEYTLTDVLDQVVGRMCDYVSSNWAEYNETENDSGYWGLPAAIAQMRSVLISFARFLRNLLRNYATYYPDIVSELSAIIEGRSDWFGEVGDRVADAYKDARDAVVDVVPVVAEPVPVVADAVPVVAEAVPVVADAVPVVADAEHVAVVAEAVPVVAEVAEVPVSACLTVAEAKAAVDRAQAMLAVAEAMETLTRAQAALAAVQTLQRPKSDSASPWQ